MTETTESEAPVAHEHEGYGEHSHLQGDQPHNHEAHEVENPVAATEQGYVADPDVQAYVTTVTLALAHTSDRGPYQVIKEVTEALESLGLRGVVVGVAAVELRGDGGLIGL